MAIGTPILGDGFGTGTGSATSASFTPASGDRLFLFTTSRSGTAYQADNTVTDSFGLSWTKIASGIHGPASNPFENVAVYWADATPAASTGMTVTVSGAGVAGVVVRVPMGANPDPASQLVSGTGSTTATATLTGSPGAVLCFSYDNGGTSIPVASGYTNLYNASTFGRQAICYDLSSPGLTLTTTGGANHIVVGVELKENLANTGTISPAGVGATTINSAVTAAASFSMAGVGGTSIASAVTATGSVSSAGLAAASLASQQGGGGALTSAGIGAGSFNSAVTETGSFVSAGVGTASLTTTAGNTYTMAVGVGSYGQTGNDASTRYGMTYTSLVSGSAPTTGAGPVSITTGAFTVSGDSRMGVLVSAFKNGALVTSNAVVTDTTGGVWGAWAEANSPDAAPRFRSAIIVRNLGAPPGTMTMTIAHADTGVSYIAYEVFDIKSAKPGVPSVNQIGGVNQINSNTSATGDPAPSLPSIPVANSVHVSFMVAGGTSAVTAPAGFTQSQQFTWASTSTPTAVFQSVSDTNSPPKTATWSTANANSIGMSIDFWDATYSTTSTPTAGGYGLAGQDVVLTYQQVSANSTSYTIPAVGLASFGSRVTATASFNIAGVGSASLNVGGTQTGSFTSAGVGSTSLLTAGVQTASFNIAGVASTSIAQGQLIGGIAIGASGSGVYSGYKLIWGDDFNTKPAPWNFRPANFTGKYASAIQPNGQRFYGAPHQEAAFYIDATYRGPRHESPTDLGVDPISQTGSVVTLTASARSSTLDNHSPYLNSTGVTDAADVWLRPRMQSGQLLSWPDFMLSARGDFIVEFKMQVQAGTINGYWAAAWQSAMIWPDHGEVDTFESWIGSARQQNVNLMINNFDGGPTAPQNLVNAFTPVPTSRMIQVMFRKSGSGGSAKLEYFDDFTTAGTLVSVATYTDPPNNTTQTISSLTAATTAVATVPTGTSFPVGTRALISGLPSTGGGADLSGKNGYYVVQASTSTTVTLTGLNTAAWGAGPITTPGMTLQPLLLVDRIRGAHTIIADLGSNSSLSGGSYSAGQWPASVQFDWIRVWTATGSDDNSPWTILTEVNTTPGGAWDTTFPSASSLYGFTPDFEDCQIAMDNDDNPGGGRRLNYRAEGMTVDMSARTVVGTVPLTEGGRVGLLFVGCKNTGGAVKRAILYWNVAPAEQPGKVFPNCYPMVGQTFSRTINFTDFHSGNLGPHTYNVTELSGGTDFSISGNGTGTVTISGTVATLETTVFQIACTNVLSQTTTVTRTVTVAPSLMHFDFRNNEYRHGSTNYSTFASVISATLASFTQSSTNLYAEDLDNNLSIFSVANTPRITNRGLTYEPAFTHEIDHSHDNANRALTGVTCVSDVTNSPAGTQFADRIVEATTGAQHSVFPAVSMTTAINSGDTCYGVVYLKQGSNYRYVQIASSTGAFGSSPGLYINVDLERGVVTASSVAINILVENDPFLGKGWWKVSFQAVATGTVATGATPIIIFGINGDRNATRGPTYTGNTANYFYLWGSMFVKQTTRRLTYMNNSGASSLAKPVDALTVTLPSGCDTVKFVFADGSEQTVTGLSGSYAVPTTLNGLVIREMIGTQATSTTSFTNVGAGAASFTSQTLARASFSIAGVGAASLTDQVTATGSLSIAGVGLASFTDALPGTTSYNISGIGLASFQSAVRMGASTTMVGVGTAAFGQVQTVTASFSPVGTSLAFFIPPAAGTTATINPAGTATLSLKSAATTRGGISIGGTSTASFDSAQAGIRAASFSIGAGASTVSFFAPAGIGRPPGGGAGTGSPSAPSVSTKGGFEGVQSRVVRERDRRARRERERLAREKLEERIEPVQEPVEPPFEPPTNLPPDALQLSHFLFPPPPAPPVDVTSTPPPVEQMSMPPPAEPPGPPVDLQAHAQYAQQMSEEARKAKEQDERDMIAILSLLL